MKNVKRQGDIGDAKLNWVEQVLMLSLIVIVRQTKWRPFTH